MKTEQWKDIKGHEGHYQCSDLGKVRRLARTMICKNGWSKFLPAKVLTPHFNSTGYLFIQFGSPKHFTFIHRLVAELFVPNPEGKPFVNHISGIKTENAVCNLEWVTRKENVAHAFRTGLISHAGEKNSQSKLTPEGVAEIRRLFIAGVTRRQLAAQFSISYSRVRDVVNNNCWLGKCA